MKRHVFHAIPGALIVLALGHHAALAESAARATIAVLPFEFAQEQAGAIAAATNVLTDALNRALVSSRKFTVVERARLDKLRREQRFTHSDLVDDASRVRAGRFLGAQFLILGTILDYSVAAPQVLAYGGGTIQSVRVSAEVQVVDSSNGQIVAARQAAANGQSGLLQADRSTVRESRALEQAAESVAQAVVGAIVDSAYPIKVVEVNDSEVHLNRGEGAGLTPGTLLHCFTAGRRLVDPDTKENLGASTAAAGSVRVIRVQAKTTVASVLDAAHLSIGDICQADDDTDPVAHRAPAAGEIHSY